GFADRAGVDRDRRLRVAGGDAGRGLPQQLAELALQLTDAGLPRVLGDDRRQLLVRDLDLALAQAVPLMLTRPEVAARDRDLLVVRVAVEVHHLHAVEQRPGDRLRYVRGGDED